VGEHKLDGIAMWVARLRQTRRTQWCRKKSWTFGIIGNGTNSKGLDWGLLASICVATKWHFIARPRWDRVFTLSKRQQFENCLMR